MLQAVLDLNLLTSAALTPKGEARAILNQARARYDLLLSDFMLERLGQVLHYPHIQARYAHLTDEAVEDYLAYLRGLSVPVEEKTVVGVSKDPEDNRILAAALDGRSQYLATRNISHFPAEYKGIKIVSPAEFHRLIRKNQ